MFKAVSFLVAVMVGLLAGASVSAHADDSALCRAAIGAVEANRHLPDAFLSAIARVESGRPDQATGGLAPWPWTINAEGNGAFFATKAEAVAAVRALQARGVRSIDVGCLQVNLMHHPEAFASLEQAFDPATNAAFAGQLLDSLFAQMGSWPLAAAAYHSQTPVIGAAYQKRVLSEWATPDLPGGGPRPASPVIHGPQRSARQLAGLGATAALPDGPAAPLAPPVFQGGPAIGRSTAFAGRMAPSVAGLAATGRSLAAYRAMPTALALRMPQRPS